MIFRGYVFFWHFSYFFHFFNVPSLFSIFRVLTLEFQCNRHRMKAKCCITCLTINLPLEKKYFWISCLSQKMTENPNFYVCSSLHLLQKSAQDFRLMAFSIGFLTFFCQTQVLQCLNRYKHDLLTHCLWPVDLTRHSNDNFCH